MASVRVAPGEDVVERVDKLIDYWMDIYRSSGSIDVRCKAAERLDQLLRAPAWPS